MTHPVSIETSTGDGLLMAMRAGAMITNMREAWWIPVGAVPVESNPMGRVLVNGQRTLPHSIMVNRRGRRFTNEAANYNAFGAAFHVEDVSRFEYANLPCWLVFDQTYVDTYGFRVSAGDRWRRGAGVDPAGRDARRARRGARHRRRGARARRSSAGTTTAPRAATRTSAAATAPSTAGGATRYRKGRRDATLGPLERGPYYAFEIHSGALGTKGGPRVDPDARVLDLDGEPIPGLYAAGNVMGSPFGMTYGGPGGTLGPAMVFGYLAGRHAAAR